MSRENPVHPRPGTPRRTDGKLYVGVIAVKITP